MSINQQLAGQFDITGGNYVSYIQHYVQDHQPLEIIAEGSVMQQGTQAIYTMPNSKIKTLSDLKGHLLGINAPLNINYLLAASVLTENGIKLTQVHFPTAPIPFPIMAAQLAAGKIDAAAMPEPFATAAEQKYGAVELADLNQGATEQFPIQGYVVTKSWARRTPAPSRRSSRRWRRARSSPTPAGPRSSRRWRPSTAARRTGRSRRSSPR